MIDIKNLWLIKGRSIKTLVWLLIFSLLISCCFYTYVNKLVNKLLPNEEMIVTIRSDSVFSGGEEVWIYLINNREISEEQFNVCNRSGDWSFRQRDEWGYKNNTIVGEGIGSSITIPIKKAAYGGISIMCNRDSGTVEIETQAGKSLYSLYSEEDVNIQINPYEDSLLSVGFFIVVYVVLSLCVEAAILMVLNYTDANPKLVKRLFKCGYEYKWVVLALFVATYIFDVAWYHKGIPNFNAFGDQLIYWETGGGFAQPGITKEAVIETVESIESYRGYGNFLPSFFAQFIGLRLNVDSYIIYFLFPSLSAAFLFGYVLPKLYEILHGEKVSIFQIILAFILFFIFYKGQLAAISGDLFGLTFYIAGTLYALLLLREGKLRYAVYSGMFFSICLAIRTSYLIGFVVVIFAMAVLSVIAIKKKDSSKYKALFTLNAKKWVALVVCFASVFVLVCTPQATINAMRGHYGLLAYDQDGAYGTKTTNILEAGVDSTLKGWVTGYPYIIIDEQIHSIRIDAGYDDDDEITMAQSLDAYSRKPLDSLVSMIKRFFAFIDVKTNMSLPNRRWSAHTYFYLFSMINYILIAVTLFCLISKKVRKMVYNTDDLLIWGIMILGPVAPMLAARVEWRQAMIEYIFYLSYSFSFCFIKQFFDKEKRKIMLEENMLPIITSCVYFLQTATLTMYN